MEKQKEEIIRLEAERIQRDQQKRDLERIQRDQRIRDEQNRAAAEKELREAELKKEEASKINEGLKARYGELPDLYPKLFGALASNPLFLEYPSQTFSNHRQITKAIFDYIDKYYENVPTYFYSVMSQEFQSKRKNIQSSYGRDKITDDTVLFYIDNTVFGSAKNSTVITKDYLCYKTLMGGSRYFAINSIKSIVHDNSLLKVNDTVVECSITKLGKG